MCAPRETSAEKEASLASSGFRDKLAVRETGDALHALMLPADGVPRRGIMHESVDRDCAQAGAH